MRRRPFCQMILWCNRFGIRGNSVRTEFIAPTTNQENLTCEPISQGDDDPISVELKNIRLDALDGRIDGRPNSSKYFVGSGLQSLPNLEVFIRERSISTPGRWLAWTRVWSIYSLIVEDCQARKILKIRNFLNNDPALAPLRISTA